MAAEERDSTADWIVPAERRPPSVVELERRIEVATGIARAAEEAAMEIGQASLEAAEQARLAAGHAERSAEASLAAARAAAAPRPVVPGLDRSTSIRRDAAPAADELIAVPGDLGSADDPPDGHESIPGSELPVAWSPVAGNGANGSRRLQPRPARPTAQPDPFDERMVAFRERAERVMARLRRLEAAPPVS